MVYDFCCDVWSQSKPDDIQQFAVSFLLGATYRSKLKGCRAFVPLADLDSEAAQVLYSLIVEGECQCDGPTVVVINRLVKYGVVVRNEQAHIASFSCRLVR